MRLASAVDFEQGGLYDPPYQDYSFLREHASLIQGRFANNPVLIVGVGYGYTIQHCLDLGLTNVWGCEASDYALAKATEVLSPAARARIVKADVTANKGLDAARSMAGIKGNGKFAAVVTEDMLGCLTDAEIPSALTECRRVSQVVLHIVMPLNPDGNPDPTLNWKTSQDWKTTVSPDFLVDTWGNVV